MKQTGSAWPSKSAHDPCSAIEIRVLNRLIDCYGVPNAIRLNNGPELISQMLTEWVVSKSIVIRHIQSNQNALIERFNRTRRTEVLDGYLFANLEQIQTITDQ